MLDPRIYRTGLVAVVLAVIIVAFSLEDQQAPLATTLAPEAYNGQNAYSTMTTLAAQHPDRRPGSASDYDVATYVAKQFRRYGFGVTTDLFKGQTVDGPRELETVMGTRVGTSSASIVIVTHRDALGSPAAAELSGTAVLLELARVLAGETQNHTIVLVSTSGSAGEAGVSRLARELPRPVDAVIALGDLAAARARGPVVVPWSNGQVLPPPVLRRTVAGALGSQAGMAAGSTSLAGELAHLVVPMSVTDQGPFGAHGLPAVLISMSGERTPAANEPTSPATIDALGRTVLQTISAIDGAGSIPAPSTHLLVDRKVVPGWAIRLLVLACMLPVFAVAVDGLARVRRRGHSVWRGVVWVLVTALPFALGVFAVLGARLAGLISAAPPGPVAAGAVPLHSGGIATLALVALVIVVGMFGLRPLILSTLSHGDRRARPGADDVGAGAGLLVVLCLASLAMWKTNVFAAALLIPALNLWIWVADPTVRLRGALVGLLLVVGFVPAVLVALYYARALGLGPVGLAWNGALLIAGRSVGLLAAVEWSVVLGCTVGVILIALRSGRHVREPVPVTVRGPVTYAGPGSLGGTRSALRR